MISIRQGTFETNSSSTHCICFDSEKGTKYTEDDLLEVEGVLKPFLDAETDEFNIYTSIKDKVRWILSSVAQHGYDPMFPHPVIKMLEQLLPNARFEMPTEDEYYYELEDIEYVWNLYWDQTVADGAVLLKKDTLKKVLLEGVIIWGNRDRCCIDPTGWDSDVDYTVRDYSSCILRVSG